MELKGLAGLHRVFEAGRQAEAAGAPALLERTPFVGRETEWLTPIAEVWGVATGGALTEGTEWFAREPLAESARNS